MNQGDVSVARVVLSEEKKGNRRRGPKPLIRVWAWLDKKEFDQLEALRKKHNNRDRSKEIRRCVKVVLARKDLCD